MLDNDTASHHLIGSLHNLASSVPFDCKDRVTIDNGSLLLIEYIGSSALLLDKYIMLLIISCMHLKLPRTYY